jgi:CyaY protein|tara:strand:- start:385 stop:708 length:324 start_codon:yes stop_codon:yes gene_type:complete
MNDTEFLREIDKTFHYVESLVDLWNEQHDLIIELTRDANVLEVEFETEKKIIINAQTPMLQLWMASELGAFHFNLEQHSWVDSRGHGDFNKIFFEHACKLSEISLKV